MASWLCWSFPCPFHTHFPSSELSPAEAGKYGILVAAHPEVSDFMLIFKPLGRRPEDDVVPMLYGGVGPVLRMLFTPSRKM